LGEEIDAGVFPDMDKDLGEDEGPEEAEDDTADQIRSEESDRQTL
jgi:hypothetical protein